MSNSFSCSSCCPYLMIMLECAMIYISMLQQARRHWNFLLGRFVEI